jgi:hypothetical protein
MRTILALALLPTLALATPSECGWWLDRLDHVAELEAVLDDCRERIRLGDTDYYHVRIAAWAELRHVRREIDEANARASRRWPWQR